MTKLVAKFENMQKFEFLSWRLNIAIGYISTLHIVPYVKIRKFPQNIYYVSLYVYGTITVNCW